MRADRCASIAVQRMLLAILALGLAGTGAELLLLEHTEGFWQKVPLVLIAAGLAAIAGQATVPRIARRPFQLMMFLLIAGGIAGFVLHFNGNREFELELHPAQAGADLFWETLKGATPALAPGMLILLGWLGLTCSLTTAPPVASSRKTPDQQTAEPREAL